MELKEFTIKVKLEEDLNMDEDRFECLSHSLHDDMQELLTQKMKEIKGLSKKIGHKYNLHALILKNDVDWFDDEFVISFRKG